MLCIEAKYGLYCKFFTVPGIYMMLCAIIIGNQGCTFKEGDCQGNSSMVSSIVLKIVHDT